jgi:hypothetical protein
MKKALHIIWLSLSMNFERLIRFKIEISYFQSKYHRFRYAQFFRYDSCISHTLRNCFPSTEISELIVLTASYCDSEQVTC